MSATAVTLIGAYPSGAIFSATAAPSQDNDINSSPAHRVGDRIIDTTNGVVYTCADNTDGAAKWVKQGTKSDPASIAISAAAGSANVSLVTFQLKDAVGNNLAGVFNLDVMLSDAATGAGLTATTASGAVVAGASGADLADYTAKKAKRVQTDATGKYILSITDTGKTHFYPVAQVGVVFVVGPQLTTPNYG